MMFGNKTYFQNFIYIRIVHLLKNGFCQLPLLTLPFNQKLNQYIFFPVKCFLYLKWNCLLWSPSLEICLFQSKVFELCNFFPIPLNYIIVMFNVIIGYKKKTRISFFSIFLNWIENTQSKQIKKWDLLWRYRCSLHKYTNKKKTWQNVFYLLRPDLLPCFCWSFFVVVHLQICYVIGWASAYTSKKTDAIVWMYRCNHFFHFLPLSLFLFSFFFVANHTQKDRWFNRNKNWYNIWL